MCSCHYSLLSVLLSLSQCRLFSTLLNKWIDGDRGFLFSVVVRQAAVVATTTTTKKSSKVWFQKNYSCVICSCHTADELSVVLLAFVNLVPDNSTNRFFWLLTCRTGLSRTTPLETCHGDSLYSDRASPLPSDWTGDSKFVLHTFWIVATHSLPREGPKTGAYVQFPVYNATLAPNSSSKEKKESRVMEPQ